MSAAHVHFFFTMRNQIKLYHWQTYMYSRHKATDDVVKSLDEHIDLFVEVFMGKYGRMKLSGKTARFDLENLTDKSSVKFIKQCIAYLLGPISEGLKETDTDLFNIRDEMLGDLNQLLYLFTLK